MLCGSSYDNVGEVNLEARMASPYAASFAVTAGHDRTCP
jgi:hypothetical protein